MKSFLGMIGYLSKFIPCYSVLTAPLRRLTSQDVPFSWGPEEDAAFKRLKDSITSDDTMAFWRNVILAIVIFIDFLIIDDVVSNVTLLT